MKYLLPFSLPLNFQGRRSLSLQALKIAIYECALTNCPKIRLVSCIQYLLVLWLIFVVIKPLDFLLYEKFYLLYYISALHTNCTDSPKSGTNLAILHQSHQDRLKTLRLEFQSKRIRLHLKNEELKYSSNIWVLKEFR